MQQGSDNKSGNVEQDYIWELFNDMWPSDNCSKYFEPLPVEVEKLEQSRIIKALENHEGNRTKTASELGIGRTCLIAKLKKYQLLDMFVA